METLFFIASKTLGMAARVETWALLLMALALFGLPLAAGGDLAVLGKGELRHLATLLLWTRR